MKKALSAIWLLLFLAGFSTATAQDSSGSIWNKLTSIDWEMRYSKMYDAEIGFPKFNPQVQALNGKTVTVKGYILPLETEDNSIIISSLPYSQCFFCGGAGIETVMAVYMKKPRKMNMEQATFKGTLELNDGETGLIYNLKDAEEVLTLE